MSEKLIGQEIEAYCGKCKTDTIHLITSVEEKKITKVMCKTCMSYHQFKKPKSADGKSSKKSASKKKPAAAAKPTQRRMRRDKWSRLLDSMEMKEAIEYKMQDNYEIETAINHKTFGLGVVKNIIDSRKIEVLFHDGQKILVQNFSM